MIFFCTPVPNYNTALYNSKAEWNIQKKQKMNEIPVMATVAVKKTAVSIDHFSPNFYFQSLHFLSRMHMTLQPTLSVGRLVSHFTFFHDFISLTSLLLP